MASINLTSKTVEGLKPTVGKQVDFFDANLPSFGIRVSAQGKKSWFMMYRTGGRLRRYTIGPFPSISLADARSKAKELFQVVAKGDDPAYTKREERLAETFEQLASDYLEKHAKAKKRSWQEDERILRRELLPRLRHIKAKKVARRDIIDILDAIVQRGAPIQANRTLALVRKVFNFAITRDIVASNPCQALAAPAKEKRHDRVLTNQELSRLWEDLERETKRARAYFQLLLLTAQRPGELISAEWSEIDLKAGWWTIPSHKAKNGLQHRVPLTGEAKAILIELRLVCAGSRWVFPGQKNDSHVQDFKKALSRVRERTGLQFVPRDLRRTAASKITSAGIPRLYVSKVLNHVERGITAVYDRHSYDLEKKTALEKAEKAYLQSIVPGLAMERRPRAAATEYSN